MNSALIDPAAYSPGTKSIIFRSLGTITSENLKEELFHAWQDAFYPGGTAQYATIGKVNIEFEAKVFKDIMAFGCCYIFTNPDNIPSNIRSEYESWISKIKNNQFTITDSEYIFWLQMFNQYHPEYSSSIMSNLNSPSALRSVITSSNCY